MAVKQSFNSQIADYHYFHRYWSHERIHAEISSIHSLPLATLQRERESLSHLFFHILPPYTYDRSTITPRSPLESVLDRAVHRAHEGPDSIDPVTGRRIRATILEALFALRLGVQPERADSEYHLVYYLLGRGQERLGVFKPCMEKAPLEDHYGASEDREAHLAEVANSQLDALLGTGVVPHTVLLRLGTVGSFQFYVSEASFLEAHLEGSDFFDPVPALRPRLDTPHNRRLPLPNFENLAFFDLLTANNDRHFRNTLRKASGELVAIDNGNSFPWCHDKALPSYKMHPLHWFKWSALPQAEGPFSQSLIKRINRLDLPRIEALLRKALVSRDVSSSQEHIEGKIDTLRDRIQTIRRLANEGASMATIAAAILELPS